MGDAHSTKQYVKLSHKMQYIILVENKAGGINNSGCS